MSEKDRQCITCKYAQRYNEEWCICWHKKIKGSRVKMQEKCVVELIEAGEENEEEEVGMSEGKKICPFCKSEVSMWDRGYAVETIFQCDGCKIIFIFPWNKNQEDWADWEKREEQ